MKKILFKIRLFFWKLFHKDFKIDIENTICLIFGGTSLPMPLDPDEEKVLINELSNNNELAISRLIEHNVRLVVHITKKFSNTDLDAEDLISIGVIGLIKAVKSFKKDKNIKLATYASRCIENEILMQLRKATKLKRETSLDIPLTKDSEGNELLLSDTMPADNENVIDSLEENLDKQILWGAIARLEDREKEIMIMRYGLTGKDEKTQKEIAEMMGISQSYISRIEKRILGKMRIDIEKVQEN